MSCISTTTTSILFNGTLTSFFTLTRGIRQGDPLSPYLFILCMEMFSRSISIAVDHNIWHPITVHKRAPPISHLFFADDIILASKIITDSCHTIIDHLDHFTKLSGQKINFAKSKVFFSKNCSQIDKFFILNSFNMVEGIHFGKYLGFSLFTSKPTKRDFQFILDDLKNRLAGWETTTSPWQ